MASESDNESDAKTLPSEICDELRTVGGRLARAPGADGTLVGTCAIHTGIQFMLRNYSGSEVATWLEREAHELRQFGHTDTPTAQFALPTTLNIEWFRTRQSEDKRSGNG